MLVNLLIAIMGIVLLILIFFKIKTLIKLRDNNLNKVDKGLSEVLNEITEAQTFIARELAMGNIT